VARQGRRAAVASAVLEAGGADPHTPLDSWTRTASLTPQLMGYLAMSVFLLKSLSAMGVPQNRGLSGASLFVITMDGKVVRGFGVKSNRFTSSTGSRGCRRYQRHVVLWWRYQQGP
jgi:hypothetical protein